MIRLTMASPPTSGITFRDVPPEPRLSRWVASCWSLAIAANSPVEQYWVAPDGCTHLVARDGVVVLAGPQPAPARRPVERGASSFGVRLQPGAARALLALNAVPSLRGTWIALDDVPHLRSVVAWGRTIDTTRPLEELSAAAHTMLRTLEPFAEPPDPVVERAVRAIQDAVVAPSVEQLSERAGLSSRQFRRRFQAAVDLTPRDYASIWRFRRCVLELLADDRERWGARAAEHGFADQSHLIREFGRLGGMAPREFVQRLRNVGHADVWDPARPEYRRS